MYYDDMYMARMFISLTLHYYICTITLLVLDYYKHEHTSHVATCIQKKNISCLRKSLVKRINVPMWSSATV